MQINQIQFFFESIKIEINKKKQYNEQNKQRLDREISELSIKLQKNYKRSLSFQKDKPQGKSSRFKQLKNLVTQRTQIKQKMDKNQGGFSYEDDINKSTNDKLIEFPTNGNSDQFKIDGGFNPLIPNKNSHYKNALNNSEDRGTIKVQIFLNIEFDFNGKNELLKITNDLAPTLLTIESVITMALLEFNEILETRNSKYRINPNDQIWNLYMSKKNGKPKQDLPALDRDNLLSDTMEDMFTLDTKDSDKLWEEESDKWQEYKEKQDEGDYGESYSNSKVEKEKEAKSSVIQNNQTPQEKEIPNKSNPYNSSISKQKKQQKKEVNTNCGGLCSFSKKS